MWLAWRQRFQERERMAAAGQTQERAMWSGLPMRADPALSRQVNERFLQPWVSLRETFDLAASTADLSPALRADYLSYLGLRVDYYQAVSRRCLNPTPATCASLVEQERRIDAFIAQRRAASA